jgi:hypothetical protein
MRLATMKKTISKHYGESPAQHYFDVSNACQQLQRQTQSFVYGRRMSAGGDHPSIIKAINPPLRFSMFLVSLAPR